MAAPGGLARSTRTPRGKRSGVENADGLSLGLVRPNDFAGDVPRHGLRAFILDDEPTRAAGGLAMLDPGEPVVDHVPFAPVRGPNLLAFEITDRNPPPPRPTVSRPRPRRESLGLPGRPVPPSLVFQGYGDKLREGVWPDHGYDPVADACGAESAGRTRSSLMNLSVIAKSPAFREIRRF